MSAQSHETSWDFASALTLIKSFAPGERDTADDVTPRPTTKSNRSAVEPHHAGTLGDFSAVWRLFQTAQDGVGGGPREVVQYKINDEVVAEIDPGLGNRVRWRDEVDGADLEDNVEALTPSAANLRTQKRAARRQRAREKNHEVLTKQGAYAAQSETEEAESAEELESIRRSPDRRALIQSILGRPEPAAQQTGSPPTSPSPPKATARKSLSGYPVSNPFLWTAPGVPSPGRVAVVPKDGLTPRARKMKLISSLVERFPAEKRYLQSSGLPEPAFVPLNVSSIGIHVFVDMSNISIGFHDCLKGQRDIPISVRIKRVPMSFHNFSLVLERGRPAAKRILAGSDTTSAIVEAQSLGYETNILDRVHKAKDLTPRQKKYHSRPGNGNTSASGPGETSGSESNAGYLSSGAMPQPSKWVEQGVDEILHLKILESVIDAEKPSTMVLATGDAAEAEYSGGFLRMVERALEKGWVVELVSFKLNTSQAYQRSPFRAKWGPMFKWIQLDDFAEFMIEE